MVILVVEFSSRGYKIRKFFSEESKYPKEIIEFSELVNSGGVKKCQNLTFKVYFLYQKLAESFSTFFFIEEYEFRSTFFDIEIF